MVRLIATLESTPMEMKDTETHAADKGAPAFVSSRQLPVLLETSDHHEGV